MSGGSFVAGAWSLLIVIAHFVAINDGDKVKIGITTVFLVLTTLVVGALLGEDA